MQRSLLTKQYNKRQYISIVQNTNYNTIITKLKKTSVTFTIQIPSLRGKYHNLAQKNDIIKRTIIGMLT